MSYQRRKGAATRTHHFFGMTTAQDIRDHVAHIGKCLSLFKDVLHSYPRGARKHLCRYISLFIWPAHTHGRPLRSSRPLKTWYNFSKGVKQLWVLKTEAALAPWLHIRLSWKSTGLLFVIKASDVVLPIFDMWSTFCATRGDWILGGGGGPLVPPRYII